MWRFIACRNGNCEERVICSRQGCSSIQRVSLEGVSTCKLKALEKWKTQVEKWSEKHASDSIVETKYYPKWFQDSSPRAPNDLGNPFLSSIHLSVKRSWLAHGLLSLWAHWLLLELFHGVSINAKSNINNVNCTTMSRREELHAYGQGFFGVMPYRYGNWNQGVICFGQGHDEMQCKTEVTNILRTECST